MRIEGELNTPFPLPSPEEVSEIHQVLKQKTIKPYNFRRSLHISQNQLKAITRINETLARRMTKFFSDYLRSFVQVTVVSVEQVISNDIIRTLGNDSVRSVFQAKPLKGPVIVEFTPDVASVMLDRLLGGPGTGGQRISELTEIETIIMKKMFTCVVHSFEEAWRTVVDVTADADSLDVNPPYLQDLTPNETIVAITLSTLIGTATGTIHMYISYPALEPILPALSTSHWLSASKKVREENEVEKLEQNVKKTILTVKAELGSSVISIEDFLQLSAGDLIRLDQTVEDTVTVKVDNNRKFYAQPGMFKGKLSVQITNEIEEEDNQG